MQNEKPDRKVKRIKKHNLTKVGPIALKNYWRADGLLGSLFRLTQDHISLIEGDGGGVRKR